MTISSNLQSLKTKITNPECQLIAVSKTYSPALILEAHHHGQLHFGENKVQEMASKYAVLPHDILWHMVGHLQSNKVKYIAAFVYMIHSVDSLKLLREINKEAKKHGRNIHCLLQIYIASEETKFGLSFSEANDLINSVELATFGNITIAGLMGLATNTSNEAIIREEFKRLKQFFDEIKQKNNDSTSNIQMRDLSMGMSGDYEIALQEGSTMVRIGSAIFGNRDYA